MPAKRLTNGRKTTTLADDIQHWQSNPDGILAEKDHCKDAHPLSEINRFADHIEFAAAHW
jgi:hypothetical protein